MDKTSSKKPAKSKLTNVILNVSIIILFLVCGYLVYSTVGKTFSSRNDTPKNITDTTSTITKQPNLTVQLDVRNGTGEDGVAKLFADYLRDMGYDVVEMGNYVTEDQDKSLILDRTGNTKNCTKVASVLGISEKNVIQQINDELYLDATVVIGKDYKELTPYLKKKTN